MHDIDLHKMLGNVPALSQPERRAKVLSAAGCLGLLPSTKALLLTKAAPKIAAKLEVELPSKMREEAGLIVRAAAREPKDQWIAFQSNLAAHGLPGATAQSAVPAAYLIGAGVPEFLAARGAANESFVQVRDGTASPLRCSRYGIVRSRPSLSSPPRPPDPPTPRPHDPTTPRPHDRPNDPTTQRPNDPTTPRPLVLCRSLSCAQGLDEKRDDEGITEPGVPGIRVKGVGVAFDILRGVLTGLGPVLVAGKKCASKVANSSHTKAIAATGGRTLRITAVRAEGLPLVNQINQLQSPYATFSLVMRGCNGRGLSASHPFAARTSAFEGGGSTFAFAEDTSADVAFPLGASAEPEALEAALYVEVRANVPQQRPPRRPGGPGGAARERRCARADARRGAGGGWPVRGEVWRTSSRLAGRFLP